MLLTALWAIGVLGLAAGPVRADGFSTKAWLQAKTGRNWSRQRLMEQFCQKYPLSGMARKQVLALLGTPELSYEYLDGRVSTHKDLYRLSEQNDGSFEIDYDEKGKVSGAAQSAEPCRSEFYLGPARPGQRVCSLESARRVLASESLAVGLVMAALGQPDLKQENVPSAVSAQLRTSSYAWRLSQDGRQMLWVRTTGNVDANLRGRRVDVAAVISLSKDCPLPRPQVGKPPQPKADADQD